MMKTISLKSVLMVAFFALVMAAPAFAQDASDVGSDFFGTLQSMITGNVGFFVGLAITVLGIWTWIIKQQTGAGVTMIIGGVLITLAPGLFNSARKFTGEVLGNIGGDDSTNNFTVQGVSNNSGSH